MREGDSKRSALAAALALGGLFASDNGSGLARYETFEFGTDIAAVVKKQRGIHPSPVKILHSRPALIQEF